MTNKITESNVDPQLVEVARRAYKAYLANSDGKSHDGKPCPPWEKLTPLVRGHWCAAVKEIGRDIADRLGGDMQQRVAELQSQLDAASKIIDGLKSRVDARREAVTPPSGTPVVASLAPGKERVSVIVNGTEHTLRTNPMTYEEVVALAGKTGTPTVTYRSKNHPVHGERSGEMHTGSPPLQLEDGMVINAMHTGNA